MKLPDSALDKSDAPESANRAQSEHIGGWWLSCSVKIISKAAGLQKTRKNRSGSSGDYFFGTSRSSRLISLNLF